MMIQLSDEYRLTADSRCWILQKKNGKIFKSFKFFSDLETLFNDLHMAELRVSNAEDFKELVVESHKIKKWLQHTLAPLMTFDQERDDDEKNRN